VRGWKPWTTQPPAGTPVDWDSDLAQGLVFAYNGASPAASPIDGVLGRRGTVVGTPYAVAPAGMGLSTQWNLAGSAYVVRDTKLEPSDVTVASYFRRTGTLSAAACLIGKTYQNGTHTSYGLFVDFLASGQNYCGMQIYTGGNPNARANVTNSAVPTLLIGTSDTAAGINLYEGTKLIAPSSANGTPVYDTTSTGNLILGGVSDASATSPFIGDIYLSAIWDRALPAGQLGPFGGNPWQLYWKRRRTYSIASSSSGATGTAAITEGADTVSATGGIAIAGAAAITEGADTVAATGGLSVSGSASITEAADTVAATGATGNVGSASITEGADTAAATGSLSVSGSASITESADTVSASGSLSVAGSAAITESADTVSATGSAASANSGSAAITEGSDTASATGSLSVSGSASIAESGDIVVATGALSVSGSASITEGADTVAASGYAVTVVKAASVLLPITVNQSTLSVTVNKSTLQVIQ